MTNSERLSKQKIRELQEELTMWTAPIAFRERVDEIVLSLRREVFFGQAGLAFLRDAWIASRVASALLPEKVRLVCEERPDFEFCSGGMIEQFEATEADRAGRRRGDEPTIERWWWDTVEHCRDRFEAIPAALERVVSKKVAKGYQSGVSLAIYLNLNCYGAYVNEGLPIIANATAPASQQFKNIFVIWERSLYRLWQSGERAVAQWDTARPNEPA